MAVVVFVLGRPGSGKTTAAQYIAEMARQKGYATCRLNDYIILYNMFEEDRQGAFKVVMHEGHKGFDVLDFSVLETAMEKLAVQTQAKMDDPELKHGIIILEFARDDYCDALKYFSLDIFLQSYFLFIEADVKLCIERIHQRITQLNDHPNDLDNRYVSEEIMRKYYGQDDMFAGCDPVKKYHIQTEIGSIRNDASLDAFKSEVIRFAKVICKSVDAEKQEPVTAG